MDGRIEQNVLLLDEHIKPFRKYLTLNEAQVSWPIDQKAVLKTTLGTTGHDKTYDRDYVSLMAPAIGTREPQWRIRDLEPILLNVSMGMGQPGKVYDDPLISALTSVQDGMDVDYLTYS